MKNLKYTLKMGIIACLFIAIMLNSCPDPNGNGNGDKDYDMTGTYTVSIATGEQKWVFSSTKALQITGASASTVLNSYTWSSKGNDVTISYKSNNSLIPAGNETFTVQANGNQVTLTLKGNSPASNLVSGNGHTTLTKVTLTKTSNSGDPSGDGTGVQTDVASIRPYLDAQSGGSSATNPVNLSVNVQLTAANWQAILTAINGAGKYVTLDLSLCTRSNADTGGGLRADGTFDPLYSFSTGKNQIVSLILPTAATKIEGRFSYFTNLASVSASAAISIGDSAFIGCTSLTSVSFPAATSIDQNAFRDCTNLASVSFPAATSIGEFAFYQCASLISVDFPTATSIGQQAFSGCSLASVSFPAMTSIGDYAFHGLPSLTSVSFPKVTSISDYAFSGFTSLANLNFPSATSIGEQAFSGCTSLVNISFPSATSIGKQAFSGCTSLISVSFPMVVSIESLAFYNCTSLASVYIPSVTNIEGGVFMYTGNTALTITLGKIAPTLGTSLVLTDGSVAKSVTVKVPIGATGYGTIPQTYSGTDSTENWGNGFRGRGWDGTGCIASTYAFYVTVYVQYQ
jgi:hypothetical protein